MADPLLPQPTGNPVLSEIMNLSPQAKSALSMAGHTMQGQAPTLPASPAPHVMMQGSPQALMASQNQDAGPAPALAPIRMPGTQGVPQLGSPAAPTVTLPQRGTVQGDTLNRQRLLDTGAGEDQIYNKISNSGFGQNHPLLGKLLGGAAEGAAKIGDIGLSAVAPGIAANLPGTEYHHDLLLNQASSALAGSQKAAQNTAQTEDTEGQTAERKALGEKAETTANQSIPQPLSAADAKAIGHPEFEGMMLSPHDKQKFFTGTQTNDTRQTVGAGHDTARVTTTGMNNATSTANNAATTKSHETIAEAADKTRQLIAEMRDNTSRANNANTNDHNRTSGNGSFKVPNDVTKRAALASNVNENADGVEKILKEDPNLVGAAAGRYTTVQQMIGSDDPNISALGVRMHNIALASNGAHGIRAQQAIADTENTIFNHFKTGPNGIKAALDATRGSMQTFLDDEKNFSETGKRESAASGPSSPPAGATHTVMGSDGKEHYTDGKKDLGVVVK